MKTNRRNFMKVAGIATTGMLAGVPASCKNIKHHGIMEICTKKRRQHFNMCGYSAPRLDILRVGVIGIGGRGRGAVRRMRLLEGVEIKALCDLYMDRVNAGQKLLEEMGLPAARAYADGSHDLWRKMVEDEDLDLVYVATPRYLHAEQCIYSMEKGKHVATEIPAIQTIEEAWALVETSEKTKRHCAFLENCAYNFFELLILNMARQGFFGEIVHVDAGYISDQREINISKGRAWRMEEFIERDGSIYPTHGLGPACQLLNINRGDRMDYMTSMSSNDFNIGAEIERRAREDDFYKQYVGSWKLGNMNTSSIRTVKGKTIMLQYNVSTPRPSSRIHIVVGTEGIAKQFPRPGRIAISRDWNREQGREWLGEEEMSVLEEKYTPKIVNLVGEIAKQVGGHGGMDFLMDWRLIDCLRNGLPMDMDVYDAAAWSSIVPLSEWSVANESFPVRIPDFTCGSYKTNAPVDIELSGGGGSTGVKYRPERIEPDEQI